MVWTGGGGNTLAVSLVTLWNQLTAEYPGQEWQTSPQTGTIGDPAHWAEGSASDHNPWLSNTCRAMDIAANVSGVEGIKNVSDAPDCEALFAMVNEMYGKKDTRVFPNGYAIYKGRITDWSNPGGFHPQTGDPHLYHVHISVSTNAAGYNSNELWPLGESTSGGGVPINPIPTPEKEEPILFIGYQDINTGAISLMAPGYWRHVSPSELQYEKARGSIKDNKILVVSSGEYALHRQVALGGKG